MERSRPTPALPEDDGDAAFWNRTARAYARHAIKDLAGYERTLSSTRERVGAADRVLELGCGTGQTALRLAPSIGHITGTDISSEMIAIANERKAAAACPNATFMAMDGRSAPWPDQSFDVVLAFNLLHLIQDRPTLFQSVGRILKPGGLFITKTPCLSDMNAVIRLAIPLMRLFGKAPSLSFFTANELAGALAASGFSILEQARHASGRGDFRVFIAARKTDP
ncbi:MAG: methyltransferase domain-containing protein [Bosea sp. (in: a-proteobacteria)]|uniref:class I SAM-dependent methyltransferase n=1 Tax=Bosea sp. (in: a-proteobacteria) TaxID=1871050 RepID=UPI0027347425|nr:class I SAM-dependent methyltransferase [Bosea sp. (in: a-proteobacteria)]MDP3254478.1 methyltransferase domain-containing protein [Bosea sp. (in: a-proteobacteria)]MDP3321508.1 methyltransferase domain-containing protein [Bosea sp. (in: a-proteobacteria)]